MKVGLIARSEDRGLGIQTWEFWRHMRPDRTLLVSLGPLARGFAEHPDRYPGATQVTWHDGQLPEPEVRAWLDGLDVVFSAETLYDWRLADWARQQGVATVVQVNPEFYRHDEQQLPHPTRWWAPTPWRMDHLPPGTPLVPVPVATDRFTPSTGHPGGPLRVLHVVGHRATADRAGTQLLARALRQVRQPMHVRVVCQDAHHPPIRVNNRRVTIEHGSPTENYWDLYPGHDVLAAPRRYGGLCLPVQEAMAAGLAIVMTDTPPNDWWPAQLVSARPGGHLRIGSGRIDLAAALPTPLGIALDALAANPGHLATARGRALAWATEHSWDVLADLYRVELADAADRAKSVSRGI